MKKIKLCRCAALLTGICLLLTACGGPGMEEDTSPSESAAGNTLSGQVGEMGGTSPASSDGSLAPSAAGGDSQSVSGAGNQQGGAQGNNASGNSTADVSAERLLNSANLKPMRTNCTALDRKVDQIFAQILNSGMSTYQEVKACFDYLVKNGIYSYDHRVEDPTQGILYNSSLDANIVQLAYSMLTTNRGVCDDYSAAFLVMTRAIGLESYLVTGQVRSKSGGYTGHTWVNIRLSGTYYIFDPQVQQDNAGAPYSYFCKTDAQMGDTYRYNDRAGMIAQFNSFRHSTEISATITVRSGGKTYQASLSQSNAANGGAVFPEGVSVGGDGTFPSTSPHRAATDGISARSAIFGSPAITQKRQSAAEKASPSAQIAGRTPFRWPSRAALRIRRKMP